MWPTELIVQGFQFCFALIVDLTYLNSSNSSIISRGVSLGKGIGGRLILQPVKNRLLAGRKIGALGQVLATKWAAFAILNMQRVTFAEQKCHDPPNTEHEVTPLIIVL